MSFVSYDSFHHHHYNNSYDNNNDNNNKNSLFERRLIKHVDSENIEEQQQKLQQEEQKKQTQLQVQSHDDNVTLQLLSIIMHQQQRQQEQQKLLQNQKQQRNKQRRYNSYTLASLVIFLTFIIQRIVMMMFLILIIMLQQQQKQSMSSLMSSSCKFVAAENLSNNNNSINKNIKRNYDNDHNNDYHSNLRRILENNNNNNNRQQKSLNNGGAVKIEQPSNSDPNMISSSSSTSTAIEKIKQEEMEHSIYSITDQEKKIDSSKDLSKLNDPSINNNSNNIQQDNERYAIIHIGPLKTGSTTLQVMMKHLLKELYEDHYEIPTERYTSFINDDIEEEQYWKEYDEQKQQEKQEDKNKLDPNGLNNYMKTDLRNCFVILPPPDVNTKQQQSINEYNDNPFCNHHDYNRINTIANQHHNSIIISSENLSFPNINITKLIETFSTLYSIDNTYIIMYYRRYYNWLISSWNQLMKKRMKYTTRLNLYDWLWDLYYYDKLEFKFSQDYYTYALMLRYSEYFPKNNIITYNIHDEMNQTNTNKFFCNGLKNANKTCEALMNYESKQSENHFNPSVDDLVYDDIAYAAIDMKLLKKNRPNYSIQSNTDYHELAIDIKYYHETINNLTIYDFQMEYKMCITDDDDMNTYLLEKTLLAESTLFPDYYKSAMGEKVIREQYKIDSTRRLCSLDAYTMLDEDNKWKQFFTSLK